MSSMQIDLYSALTGVNIDPDTAKTVVASLQEHIEMQVSHANEAVLAKLDGVETRLAGAQATLLAKLDAVVQGSITPMQQRLTQLDSDKQLRVQRLRWVIGTMLGTIGAGYTVLHALHVF